MVRDGYFYGVLPVRGGRACLADVVALCRPGASAGSVLHVVLP